MPKQPDQILKTFETTAIVSGSKIDSDVYLPAGYATGEAKNTDVYDLEKVNSLNLFISKFGYSLR